MSHMPDSVAERLQHLRGTSLDSLPHTNRDEHVARLLQGERVAEGLVVIEHHIPLLHQHGRRSLTPITTLHHPRPPVGQALPAEQLVFLDTETKTMMAQGNPKALLADPPNARVRAFLNREPLSR